MPGPADDRESVLPAPPPVSRALAGGIAAVSAAALVVSAYLTWASVSGAGPVGCGGGSGCGEVLGSKWSKLLGVPVSGLAAAMYLAVLAVTPWLRSDEAGRRRVGVIVVALAGTIAALAAVWFLYLQAAVLGAWCPYCIVDHALGLTLAGLVWAAAPRISLRVSPLPLLLVTAMALAQANSRSELQSVGGLADGAPLTQADRVVLIPTALEVDPADEPHFGPLDARHTLALMFDYACPHCRRSHAAVLEHMERTPGDDLLVLALPVPLTRACNPYAPEEMPERFNESCELARIALAVNLADRSKFDEFDGWMFEPELPRSAADARAKAEALVGAEAYAAAAADERVEAVLKRNIEAYGKLGDQRRLPVTLVPGRDPLLGTLEDVEAVAALLAPLPAVP